MRAYSEAVLDRKVWTLTAVGRAGTGRMIVEGDDRKVVADRMGTVTKVVGHSCHC